MAVIQTIRNKYGKVAGGVIALALVGFIISDATSGSLANFFSGKKTDVMNINGTKVEPMEYNERVKEYETLYMMFNQRGNTLDEATRAQMNEQLMQMMVYEEMVNKECDKVGIEVSKEEKDNLIYSMNADPMVKQFQIEGNPIFNNPETNQFDLGRVKGFEKEMAEQGDRIDPSGKIRQQWSAIFNYVRRSARVRKFNALFTGSTYIPKFQIKRAMQEQNSIASIKYVKVPYTSISDAEAKVSDDEIKEYMKKHAALYTNDAATRAIDYVSFDIVPSSADTARALNQLIDMKGDLATTTDAETFVNGRSDNMNSYTEAYFNARTLTSRVADTIMSMPIGEVFGPYYENGSYNIVKVTDRKVYPDSVKVRHILVRTKERGNDLKTDTAASMKIDSAIASIKSGVAFDSVMSMYSEDEPSKGNKGEYTFTLLDRPGISKEFGDFIFNGKAGESKKVKVSNDNYAGYHYIEILEQSGTGPSVQIALVAKNLVPSDSTIDALYSKAVEFAGKNTTPDAFDATAKKENLDKRVGDNIKISNFTITGLGPAREVVRWTFENKVGKVSDVFQLGDQRYVVAKISSVTEKGLKEITALDRPLLEQKVREEKKAAIIAKKFSGKSLDAIASETQQEVVQSDSVVLAGAYIPNLGYEPKVVGYTYNTAFQPNTVSPGIKGQSGVYFITVLNRTSSPLPPDGDMMNQIMAQQRSQKESQLKNVIDQSIQQAIIRKADVEYYPANF